MGRVNIPLTPHLLASLFFGKDEFGEVTASIEPTTGSVVLHVEHGDLPDMERAVVQVSQRQGLWGQRHTIVDGVSDGERMFVVNPYGQWQQIETGDGGDDG